MEGLAVSVAQVVGSAYPGETIAKLAAFAMDVGTIARGMGLTGRKTPEEVVLLDYPDARELVLLISGPVRGRLPARGLRMLDFGTGAGLPGVAIAALAGDWEVDLVDRKAKSGAFLRTSLARIGIENATFHVKPSPPYDLFVARAVAPPHELLRIAGKLLRPDGLACLLGGDDTDRMEKAGSRQGWMGVGSSRYALPNGAKRGAVIVENVLKSSE